MHCIPPACIATAVPGINVSHHMARLQCVLPGPSAVSAPWRMTSPLAANRPLRLARLHRWEPFTTAVLLSLSLLACTCRLSSQHLQADRRHHSPLHHPSAPHHQPLHEPAALPPPPGRSGLATHHKTLPQVGRCFSSDLRCELMSVVLMLSCSVPPTYCTVCGAAADARV